MRSTQTGESLLLAVLAANHFTNILDFVIMMPLGPQFMRVFSLTASQFGLLVSSYTVSASFSGLAGAFFLDRYDRRRSLLFLYAGFTLATLMCALSGSFYTLLLSRVLAGGFGGLMAATVFTIVADVIAFPRRGRAMGLIMSAFSVASIAGVPLGLYLAQRYNWHYPFLGLAFFSALVWLAAYRLLPAIDGHLQAEPKSFRQTMAMFLHKRHLQAFSLTVGLMLAAFSIVPYLSTHLVANVAVAEKDLAYIYLVGGIFTLVTQRVSGRLTDHFGGKRVFTVMALFSIVPILFLTHLQPVSLPLVLLVTTVFMVSMAGRFVPAMTLITSSANPADRGGFMSMNSSVQQMASGLAALVAGLILQTTPAGRILHYDLVGYLSVFFVLVSIALARSLSDEKS